MIEINCNKCENLAETGDRCTLYGSDAKKATAACRSDLFMNYTPRPAPAGKFTPGHEVWVVERDEAGNPCEVTGYVYLATVGHAVILTAYIDDLEELGDLLDYHIEQTYEDYDTHLAVFPACDCYPNRLAARCALNTGKEAQQ